MERRDLRSELAGLALFALYTVATCVAIYGYQLVRWIVE
jgi:hypothetical protein